MPFRRRLKIERCVKCGKAATDELVTENVVRIGVYCKRCVGLAMHERLDLEREAEKRGIRLKP